MGFHMPLDGYGYGTIKIAEALLRHGDMGTGGHGEPWNVIDMRAADGGGMGARDNRKWWLAGRAVALCMPDWLPQIDAEDGVIAFTMFEATKLPPGWAAEINRYARALIVPCQWNAEVFRANGVTVPIRVVKWGVDAEDYPLREVMVWAPRAGGPRPYTFLWSGTPDRRKGYDLAYRCFWQAFGHDPSVRLVMHFRRRPVGLVGSRDPNVRIIEGMFDRPTLRLMLARADCFVFPSRGEGWGAPPREAAATGLPVIATHHGGLAEDIEHWALPLRVKGSSQADFGIPEWTDIGEWAEPDPDHLIELMRWCAGNPEQAAGRGLAAAAWLREHATWEQTAREVEAVGAG
jgi:glycosyltransferase involved in cell wall biosynthesis